jgi:hypothetical protein
VAEQLVAQARAKGTDPVGLTGLLTRLTKQVCETALEEDVLASSRARSNCTATRTAHDGADDGNRTRVLGLGSACKPAGTPHRRCIGDRRLPLATDALGARSGSG